ncbi:DUF3710 domain-containing protein [Arthrobacter sp. L77]|uniref:DUF3710 domain-containing protein n=1 Tax=Arthrobacter sp. L77 TaxID=1496689 RepID=UPI0005BE11F8|nr:DUF3710 domain-containing protein [Arthrobacter sp. L77]
MAFGRPRKKKQDDVPDASEQQDHDATAAPGGTVDEAATGGTADAPADAAVPAAAGAPGVPQAAALVSSADYDRATHGPFDLSEQDTASGYIDLGAVRINAADGLQLRLEVEERSKRVIAVTLDLGGSTLQLQAFAAPKTEGLWDEIREQIGTSVGAQGGTVEERPGRLGTELFAKLPAQTPDGQAGYRVARFVGINGPRWFLRGVFGGPAALEPAAAAPMERLFRSVVVVRGDHPLPPRELLQLKLPKEAAAGAPAAPAPAPARPDLNPLERGPEITETR